VAVAIKPFESRLEEIIRRREELDALEAEWVGLVGEYDRSGEWAADGFLSATAGLRTRCRMTHGIASSAVRLGRRLEQLPATKAAFAAGEISRSHAKVIADAYPPQRAADLADAEQIFAKAAKSVHIGDLHTRPVRQTSRALVEICNQSFGA
jgi:hypothetical protein